MGCIEILRVLFCRYSIALDIMSSINVVYNVTMNNKCSGVFSAKLLLLSELWSFSAGHHFCYHCTPPIYLQELQQHCFAVWQCAAPSGFLRTVCLQWTETSLWGQEENVSTQSTYIFHNFLGILFFFFFLQWPIGSKVGFFFCLFVCWIFHLHVTCFSITLHHNAVTVSAALPGHRLCPIAPPTVCTMHHPGST